MTAGAWRSVLRPWSLRSRVLAGILALLVVLSAIIGGVSTALLRGNLVERLDAQVLESVQRSRDVLIEKLGGPPSGVGGFVLGEGAGAVGAVVVNGRFVIAGYLDEFGEDRELSTAQRQALVTVPADGRPHTVELGGGFGAYRVAIEAVSSNTGVIVGLPLADAQATVTQLLVIIGLVTAGAAAIAVLLGTVVVRFALRPLDRVVTTATRVSELRLEEGEVELAERVPEADTAPSTEVGRVGAALNRLLGRVESALTARQASEAKLRRFVADASHELRTPLASIRGYSEFVRTRADGLEPDFRRSLERIDAESQRMTGLVEDLLLLARLDAGRALAEEPVDLTRLVVDAVSDAHVAGPDHRWELEVPEEPVVIPGDAARLHQAVANLLANARIHTPPGTTVTARLQTVVQDESAPEAADPRVAAQDAGVPDLETPLPGGGILHNGSGGTRSVPSGGMRSVGSRGMRSVRVSVVDDGPGIPEQAQSALFERFVRGDDSRARVTGTTGLGLAIVKAIVEGHGGTVAVTSEPGRTEFVLELPARDAPAETSSAAAR